MSVAGRLWRFFVVRSVVAQPGYALRERRSGEPRGPSTLRVPRSPGPPRQPARASPRGAPAGAWRSRAGQGRGEPETPAAEWIPVARDHPWTDKPRWSPDGRLLYFISNQGSSFFNLWAVRFDPKGGALVGAPFPLTRFDSPAQVISPCRDDHPDRHFEPARVADDGERARQHLAARERGPLARANSRLLSACR